MSQEQALSPGQTVSQEQTVSSGQTVSQEQTVSPGPQSTILKACVLATGISGIVAEYVMATLASYLLGDAILHWTLVISLMLFAMGIGSRLSRLVRGPLLDAFVGVELALSVLVAASAPVVYLLSAYSPAIGLIIYSLAFAIGLLIGIELPLVTRLNQSFEELRLNIGSVMEKDYYGALIGGLFFALVGLPYLGLTYTPLVLGTVNFAVAVYLAARYRGALKRPRAIVVGSLAVAVGLAAVAVLAEPIVRYGEQQKYRDRVIYQEQSRFQRIVMTRWKADIWLYLDGHQQFSSVDEERYHEPLVHPAMRLAAARRRVLVLGGGDGLAIREILMHADVEAVTLVELDPAVTRLATTHPELRRINRDALTDPRVEIVHRDGYGYLLDNDELFDVMIIDLPDPRTISLARLYSRPFYELAARHLTPGGVLVTQATSPFFSRRAFLSILKSVRATGLAAVPYHNHVPTLGEWSWVLAQRGPARVPEPDNESPPSTNIDLRPRLMHLDFEDLDTHFLNTDAMVAMLHFGKDVFDDLDTIDVSEESSLAVFTYYRDSDWDLY